MRTNSLSVLIIILRADVWVSTGEQPQRIRPDM